MEVAEIIDSVDIVEYISQYCELEKKSDGEYWGLSPLKEEHTPSFSVNGELQRFYDFSSGTGGNILSFIIAYNHCSVSKGIKILKEYAGIKDDGEHTTRLNASSIARKYRKPAGKQKTEEREVLPANYMDRFAPPGDKLAGWEAEGITAESAEKFLVRYDRFSNRLVFPIRDVEGGIINVCGRTLDPDYKEKGLRKYT